MTRRVYKNPPIQEALAEFRFASSGGWDPILPGRFFAHVADDYPEKPEQRWDMWANFGTAASGEPRLAVAGGPSAVHFRATDRTRLINLGQGRLSVHMLAPYQGEDGESGGWGERAVFMVLGR